MSWLRVGILCPGQDVWVRTWCPGQDVLSQTSEMGRPSQDVLARTLCPVSDVLVRTFVSYCTSAPSYRGVLQLTKPRLPAVEPELSEGSNDLKVMGRLSSSPPQSRTFPKMIENWHTLLTHLSSANKNPGIRGQQVQRVIRFSHRLRSCEMFMCVWSRTIQTGWITLSLHKGNPAGLIKAQVTSSL